MEQNKKSKSVPDAGNDAVSILNSTLLPTLVNAENATPSPKVLCREILSPLKKHDPVLGKEKAKKFLKALGSQNKFVKNNKKSQSQQHQLQQQFPLHPQSTNEGAAFSSQKEHRETHKKHKEKQTPAEKAKQTIDEIEAMKRSSDRAIPCAYYNEQMIHHITADKLDNPPIIIHSVKPYEAITGNPSDDGEIITHDSNPLVKPKSSQHPGDGHSATILLSQSTASDETKNKRPKIGSLEAIKMYSNQKESGEDDDTEDCFTVAIPSSTTLVKSQNDPDTIKFRRTTLPVNFSWTTIDDDTAQHHNHHRHRKSKRQRNKKERRQSSERINRKLKRSQHRNIYNKQHHNSDHQGQRSHIRKNNQFVDAVNQTSSSATLDNVPFKYSKILPSIKYSENPRWFRFNNNLSKRLSETHSQLKLNQEMRKKSPPVVCERDKSLSKRKSYREKIRPNDDDRIDCKQDELSNEYRKKGKKRHRLSIRKSSKLLPQDVEPSNKENKLLLDVGVVGAIETDLIVKSNPRSPDTDEYMSNWDNWDDDGSNTSFSKISLDTIPLRLNVPKQDRSFNSNSSHLSCDTINRTLCEEQTSSATTENEHEFVKNNEEQIKLEILENNSISLDGVQYAKKNDLDTVEAVSTVVEQLTMKAILQVTNSSNLRACPETKKIKEPPIEKLYDEYEQFIMSCMGDGKASDLPTMPQDLDKKQLQIQTSDFEASVTSNDGEDDLEQLKKKLQKQINEIDNREMYIFESNEQQKQQQSQKMDEKSLNNTETNKSILTDSSSSSSSSYLSSTTTTTSSSSSSSPATSAIILTTAIKTKKNMSSSQSKKKRKHRKNKNKKKKMMKKKLTGQRSRTSSSSSRGSKMDQWNESHVQSDEELFSMVEQLKQNFMEKRIAKCAAANNRKDSSFTVVDWENSCSVDDDDDDDDNVKSDQKSTNECDQKNNLSPILNIEKRGIISLRIEPMKKTQIKGKRLNLDDEDDDRESAAGSSNRTADDLIKETNKMLIERDVEPEVGIISSTNSNSLASEIINAKVIRTCKASFPMNESLPTTTISVPITATAISTAIAIDPISCSLNDDKTDIKVEIEFDDDTYTGCTNVFKPTAIKTASNDNDNTTKEKVYKLSNNERYRSRSPLHKTTIAKSTHGCRKRSPSPHYRRSCSPRSSKKTSAASKRYSSPTATRRSRNSPIRRRTSRSPSYRRSPSYKRNSVRRSKSPSSNSPHSRKQSSRVHHGSLSPKHQQLSRSPLQSRGGRPKTPPTPTPEKSWTLRNSSCHEFQPFLQEQCCYNHESVNFHPDSNSEWDENNDLATGYTPMYHSSYIEIASHGNGGDRTSSVGAVATLASASLSNIEGFMYVNQHADDSYGCNFGYSDDINKISNIPVLGSSGDTTFPFYFNDDHHSHSQPAHQMPPPPASTLHHHHHHHHHLHQHQHQQPPSQQQRTFSNLIEIHQSPLKPPQSSPRHTQMYQPFVVQKGNVLEIVPKAQLPLSPSMSAAESDQHNESSVDVSSTTDENDNADAGDVGADKILNEKRQIQQQQQQRQLLEKNLKKDQERDRRRLEKCMRKEKLRLEIKRLELECQLLDNKQVGQQQRHQQSQHLPPLQQQIIKNVYNPNAISGKSCLRTQNGTYNKKRVIFSDGKAPGDDTSVSGSDDDDNMDGENYVMSHVQSAQSLTLPPASILPLRNKNKRKRRLSVPDLDKKSQKMFLEKNAPSSLIINVAADDIQPFIDPELENMPPPQPPTGNPPANLPQPQLRQTDKSMPKLIYFHYSKHDHAMYVSPYPTLNANQFMNRSIGHLAPPSILPSPSITPAVPSLTDPRTANLSINSLLNSSAGGNFTMSQLNKSQCDAPKVCFIQPPRFQHQQSHPPHFLNNNRRPLVPFGQQPHTVLGSPFNSFQSPIFLPNSPRPFLPPAFGTFSGTPPSNVLRISGPVPTGPFNLNAYVSPKPLMSLKSNHMFPQTTSSQQLQPQPPPPLAATTPLTHMSPMSPIPIRSIPPKVFERLNNQSVRRRSVSPKIRRWDNPNKQSAGGSNGGSIVGGSTLSLATPTMPVVRAPQWNNGMPGSIGVRLFAGGSVGPGIPCTPPPSQAQLDQYRHPSMHMNLSIDPTQPSLPSISSATGSSTPYLNHPHPSGPGLSAYNKYPSMQLSPSGPPPHILNHAKNLHSFQPQQAPPSAYKGSSNTFNAQSNRDSNCGGNGPSFSKLFQLAHGTEK